MVIKRGGTPAHQVRRWAPLLGLLVLALLLWWLSGDAWPWLWALGGLLVLVLLGAPRHVAGPCGLLAAVVVWLTAWPWWGWLALLGGLVLALGLHWLGLYLRTLRPPGQAGRARSEITEPIPRITPHGVPGWRGRPVRRWHAVTTLAAGGVLLAGAITAWQLDAVARDRQQQAELDAAHTEGISRILPRSGYDLVQYAARAISLRQPGRFCFTMVPQAARDFAAAHGAPTCEAAIDAMSARTPNGIVYENSLVRPLDSKDVTYSGTRKRVDACSLNLDPPGTGPDRLGIFTMDDALGGGGGAQVVAFTRCLP